MSDIVSSVIAIVLVIGAAILLTDGLDDLMSGNNPIKRRAGLISKIKRWLSEFYIG